MYEYRYVPRLYVRIYRYSNATTCISHTCTGTSRLHCSAYHRSNLTGTVPVLVYNLQVLHDHCTHAVIPVVLVYTDFARMAVFSTKYIYSTGTRTGVRVIIGDSSGTQKLKQSAVCLYRIYLYLYSYKPVRTYRTRRAEIPSRHSLLSVRVEYDCIQYSILVP